MTSTLFPSGTTAPPPYAPTHSTPPCALPSPPCREMQDRPRNDGGSPLALSSASRSRSSSPPPRSARRGRTSSAPADEMRIQVHDDGLVEFSVTLDADLDAEQLASLVAAVRSSARPRVKRSNYASRRNGGVASDAIRSSSDVLAFAQQQHQLLDQLGNSTPVPLQHSPRLPDRVPSIRSEGRQLSPSKLSSSALASSATDEEDRLAWVASTKRSSSTPDLRGDIARLAALRARDDSDPALFGKPEYNGFSSKFKFADEAEDPIKPPRPFPDNQLVPPTEDDLNKNWRDVEYELTEPYRSSEDGRGSGTGSSGPAVAAHSTFHVPPSSSGSSGRQRRPWRLFSQLGARFRKRSQPDLYVPANETNSKSGRLPGNDGTQKGGHSGKGGMKMPSSSGGGGPYLEFATLLTPEQALAELARFAKLRGFQVWRRPGEHKLRCIRKLSSSEEMHLVLLVESEMNSPSTLVRIRRARGDRGRTEWWRFSHFHRDVMARFSATGLSVLPTDPPIVQQTALSFHEST